MFGLTCDLPVNLRGKDITSIPLDKFICNITEKCASGCTCSKNLYHKNINIVCPNYTELPDELPSLPGDNFSYFLNFEKSHLKELRSKPYLWNASVAIFSHGTISKVTLDVLLALSNGSKLYLDHNQLQTLPNNLSSIDFKGQAELYLSGNPWVCECKVLKTRDWIATNSKVILDVDQIICHSPHHVKNKVMKTLDRVLFCPQQDMTKFIIVGLVIAVVALFVSMSVCIVYRKRAWIYKKTGWHPLNREEAADHEGKEFDVFVSYADEDEAYVGEYLIPELQNLGFKVCFHRVNFHAGKPITTNIFEAIDGSKRTLVFFSNDFKQSNFCMWEFSVALEMDLKEGTNRLITIKDTDLDIETLDVTPRSYFKRSTYIEKESADFWENLLYSLPIERMGAPYQCPQEIDDAE